MNRIEFQTCAGCGDELSDNEGGRVSQREHFQATGCSGSCLGKTCTITKHVDGCPNDTDERGLGKCWSCGVDFLDGASHLAGCEDQAARSVVDPRDIYLGTLSNHRRTER